MGKKGGAFPFDDDCERPACDDMVSKMKQAAAAAAAASQTKTLRPKTMPKAGAADDNGISDCPPTSGALGKASWTLLHSMAAWYPDEPTAAEQDSMRQFFGAFARFYPCTWCAKDFQENLAEQPVRAESRQDLCQWLCQQHNLVNEKLGKPLFSCDMKDLDERWRKSRKEKCQGSSH